MAKTKISELTASGALTGAELVEVVQSSTNKRTTTQAIADLAGAGGVAWGAITGTLADQTDLNSALGAKQTSDADLTTISGLTPTNDDVMQYKAGAWANRTVAQLKTDLGVPTYARYVALLSQTGTDAPVATVLENTLGGTVVWTYNSTGNYIGTLASAFTANKTFILLGRGDNAGVATNMTIYRNGADSIGIELAEDDILNNTPIEIRVYP